MGFIRQAACAFALAVVTLSPALADATQYAQLGRGGMPVAPAHTDPAFAAAALYAHNVERRLVGVRDLAWSEDLAAEAARWARSIASRGVMEHEAQRVHGENLWVNTIDRRSVGSMIGGWSIERSKYIPGGRHPNVSRTGHWKDVGHYTQMVWHNTTKVGCAVARGAQKDFLVCRYDPIGNWRGEMAYVPQAVAEALPAHLTGQR